MQIVQEILPKQALLVKTNGKDQLDNVDLDRPITLRILMELFRASPKQNDGGDRKLWSVSA